MAKVYGVLKDYDLKVIGSKRHKSQDRGSPPRESDKLPNLGRNGLTSSEKPHDLAHKRGRANLLTLPYAFLI